MRDEMKSIFLFSHKNVSNRKTKQSTFVPSLLHRMLLVNIVENFNERIGYRYYGFLVLSEPLFLEIF